MVYANIHECPDLDVALITISKKLQIKDRDFILENFNELMNEVVYHGMIWEEKFDRLNFIMDSDSNGRVFELSKNSEAHERAKCLTHLFQKQRRNARRWDQERTTALLIQKNR